MSAEPRSAMVAGSGAPPPGGVSGGVENGALPLMVVFAADWLNANVTLAGALEKIPELSWNVPRKNKDTARVAGEKLTTSEAALKVKRFGGLVVFVNCSRLGIGA